MNIKLRMVFYGGRRAKERTRFNFVSNVKIRCSVVLFSNFTCLSGLQNKIIKNNCYDSNSNKSSFIRND
jgi:hypothetical protein